MSGFVNAAKHAMGLGGPKIRYAVVGCGDISQRSFMPAVSHTHNSEIVALVTGDPMKANHLSKEYGNATTYTYEQFDQLIQSKTIDAIYLATPNWRHLEFAVPALRAGIHVLLEKPMELSTEKCMAIIEAQRASGAKLMIAYRLHFEPATIAAIEKMFAQNCRPDNHRVKNGVAAGPIWDMGTYPVNAVRNLFGCEPILVSAIGTRHLEANFPSEFDDTVSVNLLFPGNKTAQFTVSYFGNRIDEYTIVGTQGSIHVCPAYTTGALEFSPLTIGDKKKHESFKNTDQFGGEIKYFSECILKGEDPEPDGEEGLCDARVLEAVVRSLETGLPQKLEPYTRRRCITTLQEMKLREIHKPSPSEEVQAAPPSK